MITKDLNYKLAHFSDRVYLFMAKAIKLLLVSCNGFLLIWSNRINITNRESKFYKRIRFITFPWHWIWIWTYMIIKKTKYDHILLDEPGFHVIGGNTGDGKTSLANEYIERSIALFNKPWYVNSDFELPRYNEDFKAYVKRHRYIEFEDVWSDWKMHIQLNKYKFGGYVIDEIHRIFDYRLNQTNEYMSKFKPFRDYCVLIRKHIGRIIGITQMNKLDIQLMQLVKYWHKPKIDIGFDYEDWMLETGAFRFKPLGWKIQTFTVDLSDSSSTQLVPYKKWYLKQEFADFDYFNTYALADAYSYLPMDSANKK